MISIERREYEFSEALIVHAKQHVNVMLMKLPEEAPSKSSVRST